MNTSAKIEVQLLVDGLKRIGVTHIVLAPGSRNAPLTIAFGEDPDFQIFVVPDERAAAFQAMGMAQKIGKPVVVACTSGSAAVNFYPAITEAFYQEIPLIVLTADRPVAWVDQGDGQTIRQDKLFRNHIRKSTQLDPINTAEDRWLIERKIAEVLQDVSYPTAGPVHINMPFAEPLYEQIETRETIQNWIFRDEAIKTMSKNAKQVLSNLWNGSKKRLVIVGQMQSDKQLNDYLEALAKDGSIAVLTEHTSNMYSMYFASAIDRTLNLITSDSQKNFEPDLIVTIGGAIISKRIKRFLRDSNTPVIRFGSFLPWMDTFQHLALTSEVSAFEGIRMIHDLVQQKPSVSTFGFDWKKLDYLGEQLHPSVMTEVPWSDLKVMEQLMEVIPDGTHLHLSNSSMIRYALLFNPIASIRYWCNRGTSGIDGSSSTAVGHALLGKKEPHVLITGDLSFFYDSNAFWVQHAPDNLRVIVVNNQGGDIFNIIPGPASTNQLDRVFVYKHQFNTKGICEAYQMDYYQASNLESFNEQLDAFFGLSSNGRTAIMEIYTGNEPNAAILATYFETMKKKSEKK